MLRTTGSRCRGSHMSPAALARRLEHIRALYKLMLYLGKAKIDTRPDHVTSASP